MQPETFHNLLRTASDWSRHDKWEPHPVLREEVLKAVAEYDLFKALFYLYFYCISECVDSYGYPVYRYDFNWVERNARNHSFIKVIHQLKSGETFRNTFVSLKDTAMYYYYMAPKDARSRFLYLLKELGWKFSNVTGRFHDIVVEAIDLYDSQYRHYAFLDMACIQEWYEQISGLGTTLADLLPYKVVHLAHLSCITSMGIKRGHPDNSWLIPRTGSDLYDFLSHVQDTPYMLDGKSRESVLETVGIALNVMQPIIDHISKKTNSIENHNK